MSPDWIMGLFGGGLIGLAGAIYLLLNGRVMGASGILGGLLDASGGDNAYERAAFLFGLIGFPVVLSFFMDIGPTLATKNVWLLIGAGILVGIGTRIGAGCTSGHGVCGISRFSIRSIVATIVYIVAGIAAYAALSAMGGAA